MNRTILIIYLLILFVSSYANDGIINSYGGNLFITKESNIKINKELLVFTHTDSGMIVEVNFEFYNPGNSRTDTVGFVTPPYMEPGMEELDAHPNISAFLVIVNGLKLEFKTVRLIELGVGEDFFEDHNSSFAYYFVVDFKPGINTISHSYLFKPSMTAVGLEGYVYYNYKLTTGKNWAGSKIDSFECRINYNKPFTVQKDLENRDLNGWRVEGEGVMANTDFSESPDNERVYVNLNSGTLVYKKDNFCPNLDINIVEYHPVDNHPLLKNLLFDSNKVKRLNAQELRYARNALFAIQGYVFKSKELHEHFSNYFWYSPNPKVSAKPESLPLNYQEILEMIEEIEKN